MSAGRAWLLALAASSSAGCSILLSFSEDPEGDASVDAGAADAAVIPDVLSRPPDAAADALAAADAGPRWLVFDDLTTWAAAGDACAAQGAHLVTFADAAENAQVAPLLGLPHRWIGLTDAAVEGSFAWVTGEPLAYTNWRLGEPNDSGTTGEDCGVIEGNNGGVWDDRACETTYGRVCERD